MWAPGLRRRWSFSPHKYTKEALDDGLGMYKECVAMSPLCPFKSFQELANRVSQDGPCTRQSLVRTSLPAYLQMPRLARVFMTARTSEQGRKAMFEAKTQSRRCTRSREAAKFAVWDQFSPSSSPARLGLLRYERRPVCALKIDSCAVARHAFLRPLGAIDGLLSSASGCIDRRFWVRISPTRPRPVHALLQWRFSAAYATTLGLARF